MRAAAWLLVLVLVAACGGANGPVFHDGKTTDTCLVHQGHAPTQDYAGDDQHGSARVLGFLSYYTAHGTQAFCDRKAANSYDRQWAQLYVRLTSNPVKVATVLQG